MRTGSPVAAGRPNASVWLLAALITFHAPGQNDLATGLCCLVEPAAELPTECKPDKVYHDAAFVV